MTIRRGEEWGTTGRLAPDAPVVVDDAAAAEVLASAIRRGEAAEVGITGGDLHRTLGRPLRTAADLRQGAGVRYPVDIGRAELRLGDAPPRTVWFLAHLRAGGLRLPFARHTVVVMNADQLDGLRFGPRAHPNDGRLDATWGRMGTADAWRARRRLASGSHLPHPSLSTRSSASLELDLPGSPQVHADGVPVGRADHVVVSCIADAGTVVA